MHEPKLRDHIPLPMGYKTTTEQSGDIPIESTIKKLGNHRALLVKKRGGKEELGLFDEKCGKFLTWLNEAMRSNGERTKTIRIVGEGNTDETRGMCFVATKVHGIVKMFEVRRDCIKNTHKVHSSKVCFDPMIWEPQQISPR